MSRIVYSQRLFAGDINPGAGTVGPIVPAGVVWVVRDVDIVYHGSVAGDQMDMFNQVTGLLFFLTTPLPGGLGFYGWRGRQVYAQGEQVGFRAFGGTWSVACSGYQLTLP